MDHTILLDALERSRALGRELTQQCKSDEDLVAVATAFMMAAKVIYEEIGGAKMVAAQFYGFADRAATEDRSTPP